MNFKIKYYKNVYYRLLFARRWGDEIRFSGNRKCESIVNIVRVRSGHISHRHPLLPSCLPPPNQPPAHHLRRIHLYIIIIWYNKDVHVHFFYCHYYYYYIYRDYNIITVKPFNSVACEINFGG